MKVHLVDGTYELFRHFYAVPRHVTSDGQEVGAVRGVVRSMVGLLEADATHLAVATDHVVESFRNELWDDYKDSTGIEPELLSQFEPLEDSLRALGVAVWPMTDFEADDALAAGAAMAARDERAERVLICTPDKDLAQCVDGERVVQLDRRKRRVLDERGVWSKFGVGPASIPDYLALVGDSADGFPGLPGFGAKTAAVLLSRYPHLEDIPEDPADWEVSVRNPPRLAGVLAERRELAMLFRLLATLRTDAPVSGSVDELAWSGPAEGFGNVCAWLDAVELVERLEGLVSG